MNPMHHLPHQKNSTGKKTRDVHIYSTVDVFSHRSMVTFKLLAVYEFNLLVCLSFQTDIWSSVYAAGLQ